MPLQLQQLDLHKTSVQPGLLSGETETVLSDGGVAVATSIVEKSFIASRNKPGILCKSSQAPKPKLFVKQPFDIVREFSPEFTALRKIGTDKRGNTFFGKDETNNPTGAYKWRGSAVKLSKLFASGGDRVVTASAGNHGQGIAWVAGRLGGVADVFVPIGTPKSKLDGLERLGANIYLVGANFDEATKHAKTHAAKYSTHFVHPFDDIDVMAGQGTIADELMPQMVEFGLNLLNTTVFVPVGGGGLLGGVSERLKLLSGNRVKIVGVQVAGSDSAAQSFCTAGGCEQQKFRGGYLIKGLKQKNVFSRRRVPATEPNNDVDGTRVSVVGEHCLPKILANVDEFAVVDPASLGKYYAQNPNSPLEPAGVLSQVGAKLYSEFIAATSQNFIALQTGRNQDPVRIAHLVEQFRG